MPPPPSAYAQLQGPFEGGPAERSWHFITFINDVGNSLEYAPVVELGRLKSLSGKLLQRLDLCGVGLVELQLADYPRGRGGRTISAHTHMVAYSDNPKFDARAAERRINRGASGSNWLGARACRIEPIPNRAALHARCLYMLKSPLQGSYLQSDSLQPTGFRSRPRPVDALGHCGLPSYYR